MLDQPTVTDLLVLAAAFVIAVLSTSRITRLLTYDEMPLFSWLRGRWDRITGPSQWNLLLHCSYCASVWVAPAVLLTGYFSGLHIIWWLINGSLAMSYLAATYMSKDGDDSL